MSMWKKKKKNLYGEDRRGGTEINDSPLQQYINSNQQDYPYAWEVNHLPARSSGCKDQKVV